MRCDAVLVAVAVCVGVDVPDPLAVPLWLADADPLDEPVTEPELLTLNDWVKLALPEDDGEDDWLLLIDCVCVRVDEAVPDLVLVEVPDLVRV